MRITVVFDVSVDGELEPPSVASILLEHVQETGNILLSEDHGEGDRWAVEINSVEVAVIEL